MPEGPPPLHHIFGNVIEFSLGVKDKEFTGWRKDGHSMDRIAVEQVEHVENGMFRICLLLNIPRTLERKFRCKVVRRQMQVEINLRPGDEFSNSTAPGARF